MPSRTLLCTCTAIPHCMAFTAALSKTVHRKQAQAVRCALGASTCCRHCAAGRPHGQHLLPDGPLLQPHLLHGHHGRWPAAHPGHLHHARRGAGALLSLTFISNDEADISDNDHRGSIWCILFSGHGWAAVNMTLSYQPAALAKPQGSAGGAASAAPALHACCSGHTLDFLAQ